MSLPTVLALASAAASATLPSAPIEAPVHAVTVYSDRARVTRTGSVEVDGARNVELPVVARGVDPRSISVSANGADLARVDVVWAPADELPRARVEDVLDAIAKVDDQLAQLNAERSAWQRQIDLASALRPTIPPIELGRPQPHLSAAGWGIALEFARNRAATAQTHLRAITKRTRPLDLERQRLYVEAQKIGASIRGAGYRVVAHLTGHGTAKLTMTYMVARARWRPIYDVQLDPGSGQLDLQFAGEVSQESGEDWSDAQLVLSTAEPATATRYPKVNTWKIGERERFIPTPIAEVNAPSPPPPAPPLPATTSADDGLRARLSSVLGEPDGLRAKLQSNDKEGYAITLAPAEPIVVTDGIIDAKALDDQHAQTESKALSRSAVVPAAAPEYDRARSQSIARPEQKARHEFKNGDKGIAVDETPQADPAATESVGLVAPAGWSRPSYSSDLPASLAGGYDLVYSALQPETVLSGKGTRRVALLSRRWPVTIERKVFPALSSDAFLVAELKSRDAKPLPGGVGHLFVGSDPAGTAQLPLILPSETVTLPLGLDRAIRPVRNVKVVTTQRGIVNKEEINEYTVTIELANPYGSATAVRVIDQIPVLGDTGAKNTEIKLTRAEPAPATRDEIKGTLEWKLSLPPSGKSTVTFVYTIKRPKGFQLRQ